MNTAQDSDVEQNYLIALQRTAAYHYKLSLLRKCFQAFAHYHTELSHIRRARATLSQSHLRYICRFCFSEWLSLTRTVIKRKHDQELAEQFHATVLAARAIDSWKQFVTDSLIQKQHMV